MKVRGHPGIAIFLLMLVAGAVAAGAAYGVACAALRIPLRIGAVIPAAGFLLFLGHGVWETMSKQNVPPLLEVFGGALAGFLGAAIFFLPPYLLAYFWWAKRRDRERE